MPNAFQCSLRQLNTFQDLCTTPGGGCFVILPDSGRTIMVSDGTTSVLVVVAGGLLEPYQVKASASWATDIMVTDKDDTGFLLTFTVGAPPPFGEVDLTIFQDPLGERCQ